MNGIRKNRVSALNAIPLVGMGARTYGDLTGAIIEALRAGPLTKAQLLRVLAAQSFPFHGPPRRVLDSVLYRSPFRREGTKFFYVRSWRPGPPRRRMISHVV